HFTSVYLYLLILPPPPEPPLFPSTTLFRSPGSIAFSGRRFDRTLCSKRHTEMVRPTVHRAASKTDPTPRRAVLLEADQLGRAHRSEEHTSELQSRGHLVCRLLLEKTKSRDH